MFSAMLTYRALVNGKFDHPDDETRARLLADTDPQGLPSLKFTEGGSLAYSRHLGSFALRYVVQVEPGPAAEQEAKEDAELKAMERLEADGIPYRDLTFAMTCMDDVKVNRRGR